MYHMVRLLGRGHTFPAGIAVGGIGSGPPGSWRDAVIESPLQAFRNERGMRVPSEARDVAPAGLGDEGRAGPGEGPWRSC